MSSSYASAEEKAAFYAWREAKYPNVGAKKEPPMSEEAVNYASEPEGARDVKGRFLPGNPFGHLGGRPKGYSQRLSVIVHNLISDELELNGKNLVDSILATRDPKFVLEFFKLASSLIPKQVELTDSEGQAVSLNAIIVPQKTLQNDTPLDTNAQTS